MTGYPDIGGVSGMVFRNLSRAALNDDSVSFSLTFRGMQLNKAGAIDANELYWRVLMWTFGVL